MATFLFFCTCFVFAISLHRNCPDTKDCSNTVIILEAGTVHSITCDIAPGDCNGLTVYNAGDLDIWCDGEYSCQSMKVYCGEYDPPGSQYNITQMTASDTACYIQCQTETGGNACFQTQLSCKGNGVQYCTMESINDVTNIAESVIECGISNTYECIMQCTDGCTDSDILCYPGSSCKCQPAFPTSRCADVVKRDVTYIPTLSPFTSTVTPTASPITNHPSNNPTDIPTTSQPSNSPTIQPSNIPTTQPSNIPTTQPSTTPTNNPTKNPTKNPSVNPTYLPTALPTHSPATDSQTTYSASTSIGTTAPSLRSTSVSSPTLEVNNAPSFVSTSENKQGTGISSSFVTTKNEDGKREHGGDKKEERILYFLDDDLLIMAIVLIIVCMIAFIMCCLYCKMKRSAKRINAKSVIQSMELCAPKQNIAGHMNGGTPIINKKYNDKAPMIVEDQNIYTMSHNEGNDHNKQKRSHSDVNDLYITPNTIDTAGNDQYVVDKNNEENTESEQDEGNDDDMYQPVLEKKETPFTPESPSGGMVVTQPNTSMTRGDIQILQ